MTRLFIKLYIAVLGILVLAWAFQAYITSTKEDENFRVVQDVLNGPVRLARETIGAAEEPREETKRVAKHFDYPLTFFPNSSDSQDIVNDVAYYGRPEGLYVIAQLPKKNGYINFGPLPNLVGPSRIEQLTGLAIILTFAALGIAILLRPLGRQLRIVEKTAKAIAGGDFGARIDESKVSSTKPLAAAFNNMASKTETLLSTQREMLQCVSHELRTPLSRIHFAIDLIRDSKSESEKNNRLDAIENSADELDRLVDELLRYVRLENLDSNLEYEDCELLDIIERLITKTQMIFPDVKFEIGKQLTANNLSLNADRISFERAVGNLINNASRHCKMTVLVEARVENGNVVVEVEDDGKGIKDDEKQKAFEPFVRLEQAGAGTGLGLAIVKRIILNHRGNVSLTDSELGGCKVQTSWPVCS